MRHFRHALTALGTALIISLFGIGGAYAETAAELQSSIDSLSSKIQALDKEIADFNKKINATQGEAKTLKAALASLELRRNALAKEIDRTRLKISQTQTSITVTVEKIGITENKLNQNKNALAETLRSIVYQDETVPPFVRTLSDGARLSDMIEELKRSSDISKAIGQKVEALTSAKLDLNAQKSSYESSKHQLESLNATLTDQKQLVEANTKEKSTLLTQTKNKESEYQKLLADRKIMKDKLEAEMLSVESKLKAFTNVASLPKTGKGVLQYPLASVNITQYFGNTPFASKNPQVYNGGGHNGIDFSAKVGTPLLAAAAGTVVGTGDTDRACSGVSYGKWVLIRHTNGLTTLYAHLSVIQVSAGQSVTSGEKIGLSGNTGYSTGPHLHFTVYASESVHIAGPTEYKSKVCGTYLIMPLAPTSGYLNPLSYL
jgi:murein DD-endopeptidase MepM/ murein hydrolase activator NlpD